MVRKFRLVVGVVLLFCVANLNAATFFSEDFSVAGEWSKWEVVDQSVSAPVSAVGTDQRLKTTYSEYNQHVMFHSKQQWNSTAFTVTLDIQQNSGSAEAINEIWLFQPVDSNSVDVDSGYSCMWYQTNAGADYFGIFKNIDGVATQIAWAQSTTDLLFNTYNTMQIDVSVIGSTVSFGVYMAPKGGEQVLRVSGSDNSGDYLTVNGMGMRFQSRNPSPNYAGAVYVDNISVSMEDSYIVGPFSDSFNYPSSPDDMWFEKEYSGTNGSPLVPMQTAATLTDNRYRAVMPTQEAADALGNTDTNFAHNAGVYLASKVQFDATSFRASADFQMGNSNSLSRALLAQMWFLVPSDIGKPDTGYQVVWYLEGGTSILQVDRYVNGIATTVPGTFVNISNKVSYNTYYTLTVDVDITDAAVGFDLYFNAPGEALGAIGTSSGSDTSAERLTIANGNGIGIGLFKSLGRGGTIFVDNVYVDLPLPFDADLSGPIYGKPDYCVNSFDLEFLAVQWAQTTKPSLQGSIVINDNNANSIARTDSESIVIDGDLNEWNDADWIDLDKIYNGEPSDIVSAKFATYWLRNNDADPIGGKLYVAVIVDDSDHVFTDGNTAWDSSDRVELYIKGQSTYNSNAQLYQDYAQQYVVGIKDSDNSDFWSTMGNYIYITGEVPSDTGFNCAVSIDGSLLKYEAVMTIFDYYAGFAGGTNQLTELFGYKEIGFDVVVTSKSSDSFGMLSENLATGKSSNAASIATYSLECRCLASDINEDFFVDLSDFAFIADKWMKCVD